MAVQREIQGSNSLKLDGAISWATRGLDVDSELLKNRISSTYSQEMIDREMTNILMSASVELTTAQTPDWRIAASRFLLMSIYKQAASTRGYSSFGYCGDYFSFLKRACEKGLYDSSIFDFYTEEELIKASDFLNPEYDLSFDYAGVNMMVNRYLVTEQNNIFELPQEAFLTISLWLASREKSNRLSIAHEIYKALASREISLATPILINLRRVKGNLSSCFITAIDDSLESILHNIRCVGRISKNGGGVGINLSRIRSSGATIANSPGASGGVIPWIRIINDTAVAVNQLGKRAGAVTVALDVWHRDIFQFLELQTENGDPRQKAFDVFPQIVVPDLFMSRVEKDLEWTLFDPHEIRTKFNIELAELWGKDFERVYEELEEKDNIKLRKSIKAKDLIKEVMKVAVETGMPYMFFKDSANINNPNQHDGYIGSGNLCQESFSNFRPTKVSSEERNLLENKIYQDGRDGLAHTCNLASINLANIKDEDNLKRICKIITRLLDNTIDLTTTPIGESVFHNHRYRTIGVGAMGLADYLAFNNVKYTESADMVDLLFEKISMFVVEESILLAKERGAYPKFQGSEWSKGIVFGKDMDWLKKNSTLSKEWSPVIDDLKKYGIRNSQLLAIAPNTSSSLLQGCTASILPTYSKFYIDKNSRGAMPICPPFLKDKFWYYVEYKNVNQRDVVEVVSRIQKWVDQGISFEMLFNLNLGITAKDMFDSIMDAWKKRCKTIYYIRTIQKDGSSIDKRECVSCAN
jgi:ribonucleoside-diphosphate reductase alpha chain